jgi:hypothetical protein
MLLKLSSFLPPACCLSSDQNLGEISGARGISFPSDVNEKPGPAPTEMCEEGYTMSVQTTCKRLSF